MYGSRVAAPSMCNTAPNIVDKKNELFPLKRNALDCQLWYLRSIGVGVVKRRTPVITCDAEDLLWEREIIGFNSPKALLNAIFLLNGKNFILRGVSKQYNLRSQQIILCENPERIQYVEHGSKNNAREIAEQKVTVKNVTINAVPHSSRCHVRVFQEFMKRVLPETVANNEQFYLQPISTTKPPGSLKYWSHPKPLGERRVKTMVRDMFSDTHLYGHFTNHSLRTTGTSDIAAGVPEALSQKHTGHRSLESLRLYEMRGVQDELNQTICNIVAGESRSFTKEYQHIHDCCDKSYGNDSGFGDEFESNNDDENFIDKYCSELDI